MPTTDLLPYRDATLPVEVRVADLLARMTVEEKARQLDMYAGFEIADRMVNHTRIAPDGHFDPVKAAALWGDAGVGSVHDLYPFHAETANDLQAWLRAHSRLGIPALLIEEALHGFVRDDCTVFPQAIGLASTWNRQVVQGIGAAIAAEMRTVGVHMSLSPVLCLARDPRWGRTEETYGEDPYLAGELGCAYVMGMQGDTLSSPYSVIAEPKHFAGHGTPEAGLNQGPVQAGEREVRAVYLKSFEPAFTRGNAMAAMCAYHELDGVPCAANRWLLTRILREEWGFDGFVLADLGCISQLEKKHHVAKDAKEAICRALTAGLDMQFYDYGHDVFHTAIIDAVAEGLLPQEVLDRAVGRVLRIKFLLGLFDAPFTTPELHAQVNRCAAHLALSRQAARGSICLLKNDGDLLPLRKDLASIAVIGPSAAVARFGDYAGIGTGESTTLLDGVRALVSPATVVTSVKGVDIDAGDLEAVPVHWLRQPGTTEPGLHAEYFPNPHFAGVPCIVRTDPTINFNWAISIPGLGLAWDGYTVRWHGVMVPDVSLTGQLGLATQDRMRLWVDGDLLVDCWETNAPTGKSVPFTFEAERAYDIRIEFGRIGHGSVVMFGWCRSSDTLADAVAAAAQAEVAIVALGESDRTSGEGIDRAELELPGRQLELLQAVVATGTPVALVLQNGRPLTINWATEHVPAILEAWYPGEFGGTAMAEVLFGDYNPAGRLPITFPRAVGQLPIYYYHKPSRQGRYVEMDQSPLYAFGHGLSYTTFAYANLTISPQQPTPAQDVTVNVEVTNTGQRAGDEVVQLYLHDEVASVTRPIKTLKGFERLHLQPGETATVSFTLTPRELALWSLDGQWTVEPGVFEVTVGGNLTGAVQGTFTVVDA